MRQNGAGEGLPALVCARLHLCVFMWTCVSSSYLASARYRSFVVIYSHSHSFAGALTAILPVTVISTYFQPLTCLICICLMVLTPNTAKVSLNTKQ